MRQLFFCKNFLDDSIYAYLVAIKDSIIVAIGYKFFVILNINNVSLVYYSVS